MPQLPGALLRTEEPAWQLGLPQRRSELWRGSDRPHVVHGRLEPTTRKCVAHRLVQVWNPETFAAVLVQAVLHSRDDKTVRGVFRFLHFGRRNLTTDQLFLDRRR